LVADADKKQIARLGSRCPHHDLARFSLSALELTVHATIHPAELLQQAFHILSSIEIHNG